MNPILHRGGVCCNCDRTVLSDSYTREAAEIGRVRRLAKINSREKSSQQIRHTYMESVQPRLSRYKFDELGSAVTSEQTRSLHATPVFRMMDNSKSSGP